MSARDEALAAAQRSGSLEEWRKAWKMKPDGLTEAEWEIYQNCDPQKIDPRIRVKVEAAMGWKKEDVDDAQEIAQLVGNAVASVERDLARPPHPETQALINRIRAALRLLDNEHITPQGRRVLEKILREEEQSAP